MYDELVKRLRELHPEEFGDAWDFAFACQQAMHEAAEAIEDLEFACNRFEKDYKALCEYLPKWIPVTERLPENEAKVLVVRKFLGVKNCPPSTYVEEAEYCYGDWVADSDEYKIVRSKHTDPLFWMPLPEPPCREFEAEEGE